MWLNAEPIWSFLSCRWSTSSFETYIQRNATHWDLLEKLFLIPLTGFNSDKSEICLCRPELVSTYCGKRWKISLIHSPAFITLCLHFFKLENVDVFSTLTEGDSCVLRTHWDWRRLIHQQDASITACGKSSRWEALFVVYVQNLWNSVSQRWRRGVACESLIIANSWYFLPCSPALAA